MASFLPGTRLGPYEITQPLGAGGMGEVYKAVDTRLQRPVAIKVLPLAGREHSETRARFEREARTIAALNHPHICTIHDVGQHEAIDFLVMEYLEGSTLAERIARTRLPLEQTLAIANQIADALDKAHRAGVVHRDLKPSNIMLTTSGAKLLDFGVAKLTSAPNAPLDAATRDTLATAHGVIVGTVSYMAPEQLVGGQVDSRADIFSFGIVLFEMLTGKRPFEGQSPASVMAAILERPTPPLDLEVTDTPPLLARLVHVCLAKSPDDRWQNARDIGLQLDGIRTGIRDRNTGAAPARASRTGLALAATIILAAGAAGVIVGRSFFGPAPASDDLSMQFSVELAPNESIHEHSSSSLAFAPDGSRLVYAVNRADARGLYVRPLQSLTAQWLAAGERAASPFFSPDGRWIAFESGGTLKKVAVEGGSAIALSDTPFFAGGTWTTDDSIVFVPSFTAGLWKVSASSGGRRTRVTQLDQAAGDRAHIWPDLLPDGNILFTIWPGGSFDDSRLAVLSLSTGKWKVVLHGGFHGRYRGGQIVFARGNGLFSVPFDLERQEVVGTPIQIVDGIAGDGGAGTAMFAVSERAIAYVPGTQRPIPRPLVWVDPKGRTELVTSTRRAFNAARIAPDGRRVVVWVEEVTADVMLYDVAREAFMRLTFGGDDHGAVWSPDGKRIAFESGRASTHHLFVRAADGSGEDQQITTGDEHHYLNDWSPDGRHLIYNEFNADTGGDLWVFDAERRQSSVFLRTSFLEKQAAFAPSGKWIAYMSNESGASEVYVRAFPDSGQKIPISVGGGEEPAWSRAGDTLYYRNGPRMMAVSVTTTPEFAAGRPRVVFEGMYHFNIVPSRTYDIAADGRFLMVGLPDSASSPRRINVMVGARE